MDVCLCLFDVCVCVGSSLAGTIGTEAPTDYYYYKELAVKRTNIRFTVILNFT
jgi:hypothetical protein